MPHCRGIPGADHVAQPGSELLGPVVVSTVRDGEAKPCSNTQLYIDQFGRVTHRAAMGLHYSRNDYNA